MIEAIQRELSGKGQLRKCPTGIQGLDEITQGGLPAGRPTLVCGAAGCGKTLLAMEFIVRGITQYGEPGVFMSFEETVEELTENVTTLGWDLKQFKAAGKLLIDHVYFNRQEVLETGEYNLDALFIRLGHAIDRIGAKRVVLDTAEVLFAGLSDASIVRAELQRLFQWLKSKRVTAIVTGERGETTLTRQGLEEYVSDCVIRLDQRTHEELSTRRLQVVKYRGSSHGTNEYPFLIEDDGIFVFPITSVGLDHEVSTEHVSSGISRLDTLLGGQGYYRGSSVLVTGTAGTGKTTIAAHFAQATCQRGERCLYVASEESPQQVLRNMKSVGVDLAPHLKDDRLRFYAVRPTAYGLEMHLVKLYDWIKEFQPNTVIIDPMSNLTLSGTLTQTKIFFIRLIDLLKSLQITVLLTNLTAGQHGLEQTEVGVSSLMDTWLEIRTLETNGERNRVLYILKSRGMDHSNQVREFRLTPSGAELLDVYVGQGTVLTGTARVVQAAQEQQERLSYQQTLERKQREFERKQTVVQAQILAMQAQLEAEQEELSILMQQDQVHQKTLLQDRSIIAQLRRAD